MDISGKTALVTGGAKRMGRAIAISLASAGVNVVINYRSSASEAEELAELLRSMGVSAWTIRADVADKADREGLIDRAIDTASSLDILVNNASIFPPSDLPSLTLEHLTQSIEVNAWAPFELGRRFADRADTGHIVNLLDTRINGYDWKHVGYHASKYLLALLTKMMAIQFAPQVAVNAVAPGLVLPPEGKDESYLETLKGELPLQRVGRPDQVADAVLYLVSSEFVTGQVIYIDGGRHLNEASIG